MAQLAKQASVIFVLLDVGLLDKRGLLLVVLRETQERDWIRAEAYSRSTSGFANFHARHPPRANVASSSGYNY